MPSPPSIPRAAGGLLLALCLVLAVPPAGRADEGEVTPDRPDVTNSAKTLPPGAVQLETGIEVSRSRSAGAPSERRFLVDALMRAGVADRLELDLGWQPLVRVRGEQDDTGIGDVVVGMKVKLFEPRDRSPWPALSLQPLATLPVADPPIGSGKPAFSAVALASFDLPAGFGLDVNAGVGAVGQTRPAGYLLEALTSASLSWDAGPVSPFVEVFYHSREEWSARDTVGFDAGAIWRVTKRVALDAAVETSLAGPGPDWAVRAGVTVRFGR